MRLNKARVILSLAILTVIFLGAPQSQASNGIDVRQAQSMNKQGALLLDVREQVEYAEIHAPKATLIPLGQLSSRIQEIAKYKEKPIAVVCHSGRRSALAVQLLQNAGFSKVSNVNGGMLAWENAGMEVIKRK
jgi:rhodanese-related sulfurtransferase